MRDLTQIVVAESTRGKNTDEIVDILKLRGWPEANARIFVSNTLSAQPANQGTQSDQSTEAVEDSNSFMSPKPLLTWVSIGLGVFALLFALFTSGAAP
jgi:hypothetical protein